MVRLQPGELIGLTEENKPSDESFPGGWLTSQNCDQMIIHCETGHSTVKLIITVPTVQSVAGIWMTVPSVKVMVL